MKNIDDLLKENKSSNQQQNVDDVLVQANSNQTDLNNQKSGFVKQTKKDFSPKSILNSGESGGHPKDLIQDLKQVDKEFEEYEFPEDEPGELKQDKNKKNQNFVFNSKKEDVGDKISIDEKKDNQQHNDKVVSGQGLQKEVDNLIEKKEKGDKGVGEKVDVLKKMEDAHKKEINTKQKIQENNFIKQKKVEVEKKLDKKDVELKSEKLSEIKKEKEADKGQKIKLEPLADYNGQKNKQEKIEQNDIQQSSSMVTQENKDALNTKIDDLKQKQFESELREKAEEMGVGYINFKGIPISAEVLKRVSLAEVEQDKIVCFYYSAHKEVRLATVQTDFSVVKKLKKKYEEKFGFSVEIFLTSRESFNQALKQYNALPRIIEHKHGVQISAEELEEFSNKLTKLDEVIELMQKVSTTELVSVMIAAGLKLDSSDIHVEAEEDGIKLRYRIDGVLQTAGILGREIWKQLISRLKLLSGLKLNIVDKPQDGRFSIFLKEDKIDVRVSNLPTQYGESVVMRLLSSKVASLKFEDLGLEGSAFKMLEKQIKRPNGMIITTGPTGSGKTTTLYAILNKLNQPETKIITIEDPIEYELKGINQSQINKNKDYTFAKGLKSIVRQDPDIVMVGEMRDLETVDIALNAALTGHLVLSTLHTNDAAGAIPRFLAMGAKPYLLAPALNLVMAQRLVRRLCDKCKKEVKLDQEKMNKVREILGDIIEKENINLENIKFYEAVGCDKCNNSGFKGRVGIFEMFEMNSEIEKVILSNEISEYKIKELAVKSGMITMVQYGLLKAIKGVTSVGEVFRVIE